MVTKATFLHNTKVASSEINEEKDRQKNDRERDKPQGRIISQNEMVHHMLKYPEVTTNLVTVNVPTTSLELRQGSKNISNRNFHNGGPTDGVNVGVPSETIRTQLIDMTWRHHTTSELLVLNDFLQCPGYKIDRITEFSI